MGLRLITGPTGEPITLAEVKEHLLETSNDRDSMLLRTITSVRSALDGRHGLLGRALMTQTWELTLDDFPASITVPLPPLQAIESIKYRDSANVLQTLDPSEYLVDVTSEPGTVVPVTSWPSVYSGLLEGVTVRFRAGYANAAAVPEPIKSALALRIQLITDNLRPDDRAALTRAHTDLEFPYRMLVI